MNNTMSISRYSRYKTNPKIWLTNQVLSVLPFVMLLLAWHFVSTFGIVPSHWVPSPKTVFNTFLDMLQDGTYMNHVKASFMRVLLGFAVSVVMGISLGVLFCLERKIADFVEPMTNFLNALSGIAWIPLAIMWFGLGPLTVTFILWNSMFFLLLFNTMVGVRGVPLHYESAVLTLGGNRWHLIFQVLLPGAMTNIVNGLRMGMGFGWRGVIAAEMIAANSGLGSMIINASSYHRPDVILLGILTIGVIWMVTDRLFLFLERRTVERWGMLISRQ